MVENIEGFRAKLQFEPLGNWEFTPNCHVQLPRPEPASKVPRRVTVATAHGSESVGIDGSASGASELCAIDINRLSGKAEAAMVELSTRLRYHISHQSYWEGRARR